MRRQAIIRIVVALGIGSTLVAAYAAERHRRGALPVEVVRAAQGEVVHTVSSTSASVEPRLHLVLAAERPGRILELRAGLGRRVRRGEIVAVMADPVLGAELVQASVDVERAERQLERARALAEQGYLAPSELEQAEYAHEAAEAKAATIRARREQLTIRAPISGTVTAEHVQPGEVLAGVIDVGLRPTVFPVVTISTVDELVVKARVEDVDIPRVRPGQQATIAVEAVGREFAGVVRSVAPAPSAGVGGTTYEVIVGFVDPRVTLVPGVRAEVRIVVARADAVARVPREAVFPCGEGRCVFLLERDRARLRAVVTGITDASQVEVQSGLRVGEPVLVGFPPGLRDGSRVVVGPSAQ